MIAIKGTNRIRGILDLSGINLQVKCNDSFTITDDQFYDRTVQTAVKMGFLTYEQTQMIRPENKSSLINCRNIYDRPLRINAINSEVRPGQTFALSQEQINGSDIRNALAKGLIEIVSAIRQKDSGEESVEIGKLFDNPTEDSSYMKPVSDAKPVLETNEEVFDPSVIMSENPKPVERPDIPDPKGKTVVWNPNHDPLAHTKTSMKAVAVDKRGQFDSLETNVEIGDINFVDKELESEQRKKHPVLKDKPAKEEFDIDFI